MDNYRLLIAFLICVGVIVLYQQMLEWRFPQPAHLTEQGEFQNGANKSPAAASGAAPEVSPRAANAPGAESSGATTASQPSVAAGTSVRASPVPKVAPGITITPMRSATIAPVRTVEVDTNLYRAILTTQGASIRSFTLDRYKASDVPDSANYEMVIPGMQRPFGLILSRNGSEAGDGDMDYITTAPARINVTPNGTATVTFTAQTADGLKLEKIYSFHDSSYTFDLSAQVGPAGAATPTAIGFSMSQPLKQIESGYHDIPMLQGYVDGKSFTHDEGAFKKGVAPVSGKITYAGFGDRYFLSAVLPMQPNSGTLEMDYGDGEGHARILFANARSLNMQVYMGPKELRLLEKVTPPLSKAIDFGWTSIIALPFLRALNILHRIAPNYGVAIILLTAIVRLLTLPMSIKSQRSMMKMQRLQPQVERIREKFKDDQERLNREMVDLYKRNGANPLGGCLPMLIQLPILWGLYEALLNAVELRQAPFWGWIRDLSAPDCLPIHGMPAIPYTSCHGLPVLVLLMAATSLLQQWMMPRQADPSQQKMMMYMPVVFSLIFIDLPAGLSLYYLASNLLGIVQQFFLNREFQQYTPAT